MDPTATLPQDAEFFVSSRGGKTMLLNGFLYRKNRNSKDGQKSYFKCIKGCPATAVVSNNFVETSRGTHKPDHLPDVSLARKKIYMSTLKAMVITSKYETINQIHRHFLVNVDINEQNAVDVPVLKAAKPSMYRLRQKAILPCRKHWKN